MKSGVFGLPGYAFASTLPFAGPLIALGLLASWKDRLALAYWPVLVLVSLVVAVLVTVSMARLKAPRSVLVAVFLSLFIGLSVLSVGFYAESRRDSIVAAFEPDKEFRASFFHSLRNAPREFQFFLHGAALKDCKPYAWSYREMGFYELPPNVAVNVLPASWIAECDIRRTG